MDDAASMRPARKGPENRPGVGLRDRDRLASMRPARKGPENHGARARHGERRAASMRPARKGPENIACATAAASAAAGFNEAGPQGAGKRPRFERGLKSAAGLQ